MSNYLVNINSNSLEEDYNKNGDNVARVRVYDNQGNEITKNCRVLIEFSQNGLLGFGTELIRFAHNLKDGRHTHIHPVEKDLISENMGIFLTADSSELIITYHNFGIIENYVDK